MPVTPNSSTPIAPVRFGVRIIERPLEHHRRAAGEQRRVDHVAVADDPADVGRRPPDVGRLQPEAPPPHAEDVDLVAAVGVDRQLRLGGRPRRGQDEGRLVRLHRLPSRRSARRRRDRNCVPRHVAARARSGAGPSVRCRTMTRSTVRSADDALDGRVPL